MAKKACSACGEIKHLAEFYVNRTNKDGHAGQCKACVLARAKEYQARPEIREKRAAYNHKYQKRYYKKNKEAINARVREYMTNEENRKKKEASEKAWVKKNRAKVNARSEKWRKRHPERWQGVLEKYRENNRERLNAEYNYRMRHDPDFKIPRALRNRLYTAIKRGYKAGSAVSDLGCSIEDFKEYIAAQFQPDMTWENWGEWHLDHIKPLNSFNLSDREQFLEACHFSNMQPLWAAENLSKGYRYEQTP